eukprot:scaffold34376_cov44-Attheya_sp.AAC.1
MRCTCSVCPPTGGCLVIGVIVTIVSNAGGGGSSDLILRIGYLWSHALFTTARQIPVDSTIVNDFSPTESYVVLCPCDKGFQYRSLR